MFQDLIIRAQTTDRVGNIVSYFSSVQLQTEYLPYLAASIIALAAVILGSIFFLRFNSRRHAYLPTGIVREQNKIRALFAYCIEHRVRLDCQLDVNRSKPLFTSCMPVDVTDNALVLECSLLSAPLASLLPEREVVFFFTIKKKNVLYHYRFTSVVIDTTLPKNGFFDLHVELPGQILPGQKRNSLRIKPSARLIMSLYLWPVQNGNTVSFEPSVQAWGEPVLRYISEGAAQFRLEDISANGAKLSILREYARLDNLALGKARYFAMLLDLWDPSHQSSFKIWVVCRVQSSIPDMENGGLKIGTQFVAWGQTAQDNPDLIKWKRLLENDEIIPLGDWVIQRHLEEFRDHTGMNEFKD